MAQSKVHQRGPATPRMNMTPLIDVTFQIIIFFMLINNIIAEQTVEMYVPDLDEPQTRQAEEMQKVVINIAPIEHVLPGQYQIDDRRSEPLMGPQREQAGAIKIDLTEFRLIGPGSVSLDEALTGVSAYLQRVVETNPEVEVELRADCALYYDQVQAVMGAISEVGVQTVHLVALLPEEKRKGIRQ